MCVYLGQKPVIERKKEIGAERIQKKNGCMWKKNLKIAWKDFPAIIYPPLWKEAHLNVMILPRDTLLF